ncbi:MAG TPA: cbb3-type cytochrome c oxidase N-terminal domain-containing protein [Ignavibacteriaceae bacterium]
MKPTNFLNLKLNVISNFEFRISKYIIAFIFSFIGNSFAAGESDFPPNYYDTVALILLLVIVITLLSIIYYEGRPKVVKEKKASVLSKISQLLTKSTPIEREKEIMFDHDFDGIKELDSKIPPWFSWLFIITIIFAAYYMIDYHVIGSGQVMLEEYTNEVHAASLERDALIKSGAFVNEETVTVITEASVLEAGKAIYDLNCIACHAADGGGIVGPNLTDDYWIHGGGIKNVFKVIKYGVVEKGMIAWQTQLNPNQMQEVASYILSLHGTTPAAPKQPEGQIWVEEKAE